MYCVDPCTGDTVVRDMMGLGVDDVTTDTAAEDLVAGAGFW